MNSVLSYVRNIYALISHTVFMFINYTIQSFGNAQEILSGTTLRSQYAKIVL